MNRAIKGILLSFIALSICGASKSQLIENKPSEDLSNSSAKLLDIIKNHELIGIEEDKPEERKLIELQFKEWKDFQLVQSCSRQCESEEQKTRIHFVDS